MVSGRRRIYWDADVWLSYINGVSDRLPILDALLADSSYRLGDIEITTSTFSIIEVAFGLVEQNKKVLDPSTEQAIDALWADRNALTLIECHEVVAREARTLIRMGLPLGWSLKPKDAIHLATAKWHNVTEFHTYDKQLARYSNHVGFPIREPYVAQPRLNP